MSKFVATALLVAGMLVTAAWADDESKSFDTYRSHPNLALQGKMARFIVAGRLRQVEESSGTPSQLCDYKRFDFAEVRRLDLLALQHQQDGNIERLAAWRFGFTDATPDDPANVSAWCETLYLDAANWSMLHLERATKADLDKMRKLGAVENNDCNWDDEKKAEVARYPEINEAAQEMAGVSGATMLLMFEDSEAMHQARDDGFTYGTTSLADHCPVIADFAKSLME